MGKHKFEFINWNGRKKEIQTNQRNQQTQQRTIPTNLKSQDVITNEQARRNDQDHERSSKHGSRQLGLHRRQVFRPIQSYPLERNLRLTTLPQNVRKKRIWKVSQSKSLMSLSPMILFAIIIIVNQSSVIND